MGELSDPPDVEEEYILPAAGWVEFSIGQVHFEAEEDVRLECEYCCERFETREGYEHHRCPVGRPGEVGFD